MRFILPLIALLPLPAAAQNYAPAPNQQPVPFTVPSCVRTTDGTAVPCGASGTALSVQGVAGGTPMPVAQSGASSVNATQAGTWNVGVTNFPATQPVSGSVGLSPNRGVATICAGAGSLGTTSTMICAAGAARTYVAIQNQSDSATVYCNLMGGTATLGPPSRKLLPNASLVQGNSGGGFVSTAAINCIATAAASPLSAEALQ